MIKVTLHPDRKAWLVGKTKSVTWSSGKPVYVVRRDIGDGQMVDSFYILKDGVFHQYSGFTRSPEA